MIEYGRCCGNRMFVTRAKTETGSYPVCGTCGARLEARRVTMARNTRVSRFEPFVSPVDGSVITSRRELADHNARNNVVNVHEGYTEEQYKNKVNEDLYGAVNKEIQKDVDNDIKQSINMLNNGHVPEVAPEGDIE